MGVSGKCHASAALYSQETTTGTHWKGGWMDLRARLHKDARGKILCIYRGANSGRPVCSQTLY